MKKISVLFLCLCLLLQASAQYNSNRNKIWTFARHAGLDFTSGTPVSFTSNLSINEGCASVCDPAGNLLFYTDGKTVYNRLGIVMPNGSSIGPFIVWTTSQGALIVPFINDANKYYVFSLDYSPGTPGRLGYSVVDMTLNGGFGDVVPGSAGIVLNNAMSEKMIAIPGNSCNVWVMTHKRDNAQFYAYEITSSGVSSTPVISNVGTFAGPNNYSVGMMKCSPDREKIASACTWTTGLSMWGLELFDFDPSTGIVSNCRVLQSNPPMPYTPYGVEFSPDNTKLYTTTAVTAGWVDQWNISLSSLPAIIASKTAISPSGTLLGDLKLGPDGKIYVSCYLDSFVDCINFPNIAGMACGYTSNAVSIAPDTCWLGLSNMVWNTMSISGPSAICVGATIPFTASTGGGAWSSSNPSVATVSSTGAVTAIALGSAVISYATGTGCDGSITINVVASPTLSTPPVCVGNTVTLSASTGAGTWASGSPAIATVGIATGQVTGISAGTALITYNGPGCPPTTTIVTVNNFPISGGSLCPGASLALTSTAPGGTWTSSNPAVATVLPTSGLVSGSTVGTTTISYNMGPGCIATTIVTVNGIVYNPDSICVGGTLTAVSTVSGGTWSSSNIAVATVGASSGVITGIAAGTSVITYIAAGCLSIAVVTVSPTTATIAGPTTVAIGSAITLTSTTSGGTWSSSDITKATVNSSTGQVTGVALGTITIYYTLPAGCKISIVVNVVKKTSVSGISNAIKPSLYPNPATNEITIKTESLGFTSFTIFNAVGQSVSTHDITNPEMKVNVRALPPGEYQVIFRGDEAREMLRFVKW